jgi:hypothetical protein
MFCQGEWKCYYSGRRQWTTNSDKVDFPSQDEKSRLRRRHLRGISECCVNTTSSCFPFVLSGIRVESIGYCSSGTVHHARSSSERQRARTWYRIINSLTWNARREVAPVPTLPLVARANILLWLRVQSEMKVIMSLWKDSRGDIQEERKDDDDAFVAKKMESNNNNGQQ